MRRAALILSAALLPAGRAEGQAPVGAPGVATLSGVQVEYTCLALPEGAQRFYVEAEYSIRLIRTPDIIATAGTSAGPGTGDPIGEFTYHPRSSGYQPGLATTHDIFATPNGELYADVLWLPNTPFSAALTIAGGTDRYRNAQGSALVTAQRLDDGSRTAFVACGWIDGI